MSLAQGWGSKEEGLGLYSCVMLTERSQDEGLSLFPSDVQTENDNYQNRVGLYSCIILNQPLYLRSIAHLEQVDG